MKFYKKIHAFTLSELLMSVLVISVVMVSMAPVITKRVNDNLNVIGSGGSGGASRQIGYLFTLNTTGYSANYDISCTTSSTGNTCDFTIPRGAKNINAIIVSGGGGGGGAAAPKPENASFNSGVGANALTIENYMRNFRAEIFVSAAGAGGGAAYKKKKRKPKYSDCSALGAEYIETDIVNKTGFCITKHNVGDPNGPTPTSDVKMLAAVGNTTNTYQYLISACYTGQTANTYSTNVTSATTDYKSTVLCNYFAADSACGSYYVNSKTEEWDLPSYKELIDGTDYIFSYSGIADYNLCQNSSSYSPYCTPRTGSTHCTASSSIYGCYPAVLWTRIELGTDRYCTLNAGKFTCTEFYSTVSSEPFKARAARCALSQITEYEGAGGGGGSGATAAVIKAIPNDVIKKAIGGKMHVNRAVELAGGTSETTSDKKAAGGTKDPLWTSTDTYKTNIQAYYYSEYANMRKYKEALVDGTIAEKYKNFSWVFFSSASPASTSDLYFGMMLMNGYPGEGADCSGASCVPGKGGRFNEERTQRFGNKFYACNYFDLTTNENLRYNDCANSSYILYFPGMDGEDGPFYGNASQFLGTVTQASGGAGVDGRYDDYQYSKSELAAKNGGDGGSLTLSSSGTVSKVDGESAGSSTTMKYTKYYPSSGGSGGGSGSMLRIHNYPVEAGQNLKIQVGSGGIGGNAGTISSSSGSSGSSGGSGNISGIEYGGKKAKVSGGSYGRGGIYQTSSFTTVSAQANVGAAGTADVTIPTSYYEFVQGSAGSPSIVNTDSSGVFTSSWGGMGGKSPTGSFGGCGGLFTYSSSLSTTLKNQVNTNPKCTNATTTGQKEQTIIPTDFINTQDYGQAGAGGGGGGWSFDDYDNPGKGGDGQPGYVYIWWTVEE